MAGTDDVFDDLTAIIDTNQYEKPDIPLYTTLTTLQKARTEARAASDAAKIEPHRDQEAEEKIDLAIQSLEKAYHMFGVIQARFSKDVQNQTLREHTGEVWFLKFSHSGKYLASSSNDKSAIIWEFNAEGILVVKHKLLGHEKPVLQVLWSPDDRYVITCGDQEDVRRWDVRSGVHVRSYKSNRTNEEGEPVCPVSCAWYGNFIIAAMTDLGVCLWDLEEGVETELKQGKREYEDSDVATTTDGRVVSVGGSNHDQIIFSDADGNNKKLIQADAMVYSFSVSEDSRYLFIDTGIDGGEGQRARIEIWSIPDDRRVARLVGHGRDEKTILAAGCFGRTTHQFFAIGSTDLEVKIWDLPKTGEENQDREPVHTLAGHQKTVNCVTWNAADPRIVASASDDQTIMIWGVQDLLNQFNG